MGLGRITSLLAFVLLLGMAAVIALPERTPRAGRFHAFRDGGGDFAAPEGWRVVDPFESMTPYQGLTWSDLVPPEGSRVAFLQAEDGSAEMFLILGPRADLEPSARLHSRRYDGQPSVTLAPQATVATRDGHELAWRTASMASPLHPGSPITCLFAHGAAGDRVLVANGGGKMDLASASRFLDVLRSIVLPR